MNSNSKKTELLSKDYCPIGPSGRESGLWLDCENAIEQLRDRAGNDILLQRVGREIIEEGFSIIPKVQNAALIDRALEDYYRFLEEFKEKSTIHKDEQGRNHRLANFHLYSEAAMKLAKNETIMKVLDFLFDDVAAVHTSLTFQYSTQQALHRDSPYFHSFPESKFIGVWTAFEDINPEAGPLSYIPRSHRYKIDQWEIYDREISQGHSPEVAKQNALALYQYEITESGEGLAPRVFGLLKKGDVGLWHPQLIHGGSPAIKPELTRHSMVVHCCPADTQIFVEDKFLQHRDQEPPPAYYDFVESFGRKHGDFRVPDFMDSI